MNDIHSTPSHQPPDRQSGGKAPARLGDLMDDDARILRAARQQRISNRDQFGSVAAFEQAPQEQERLILSTTKVPAEVDNQRAHAQASPGFGHDRCVSFSPVQQPAQFSVLGVDVFCGQPGDQPAAPPVEDAQLEHELLEECPGRSNNHRGAPTPAALREHVFGRHGGIGFDLGFVLGEGTHGVVVKMAIRAARPALPRGRAHAERRQTCPCRAGREIICNRDTSRNGGSSRRDNSSSARIS